MIGFLVMVVCGGTLLAGMAIKYWVDHSHPSERKLNKWYGKGNRK